MRRAVVFALGGLLLALALVAAWAWQPDRDRAVLEARHARGPEDFVAVAGLRLHLRDEGPHDAPAVILLHGFGASLHTWDGWAGLLADRFRIVRFDLPGFGLTGPDPTGDYGDARAHAVLVAVMDRLGIGRASLIGSSMGGRIAWSFAAAHPERVDRLVLVAPDGFESPGRTYGVPTRVPPFAQLLPYFMPEALVRWSLAGAYGDASRMTEEVVRRTHEMLIAPGVRRAILDRIAGHVLHPPEERLRSITAPVLVLWGEKDRAIPPARAEDYRANLRDVRVVVFPGLGHLPFEEDPQGTIAVVRSFLEGH